MRHGSAIEPERDRAPSLRTSLDVIDDERRLFLIVNVEAGMVATDVDLDLRPHVRHEVDVRLVMLDGVSCREPRPRPVRVRDMLGGMIPPFLIVGPPVRGPKVEGRRRSSCRSAQTKSDTDEAARPFKAPGAGTPAISAYG